MFSLAVVAGTIIYIIGFPDLHWQMAYYEILLLFHIDHLNLMHIILQDQLIL